MFKLNYIKLCYYLIMKRLATFFIQSRSAQIYQIRLFHLIANIQKIQKILHLKRYKIINI
jgi:hypothetical protein